MLERVKEIIEEQLNLDIVEITEETRLRMICRLILWICLNWLWHLKRNMVWKFLLKN